MAMCIWWLLFGLSGFFPISMFVWSASVCIPACIYVRMETRGWQRESSLIPHPLYPSAGPLNETQNLPISFPSQLALAYLRLPRVQVQGLPCPPGIHVASRDLAADIQPRPASASAMGCLLSQDSPYCSIGLSWLGCHTVFAVMALHWVC